jgi:thioester reductase-like protein
MTSHSDDIRNEFLICKKWNARIPGPADYPDGILVTGANSFIGSHVVRALQHAHSGPVHLLLRAPSVSEAVMKMEQAFSQWGLGDFHPEKFRILLGDVTLNRMNLNQKDFNRLKKEVGSVIHLAMTPLYHLPYHHFQRVWVPELERMIDFCMDPDAPKSLHYASSYNANFFNTDDDFAALNTNAWQSGYAGFKWVANQSILNAMGQGLRGCIYDIPLVLGSERQGICPGHYSIWLILDIFLKTGHFFPFTFRIIPVDILAEIIVFNILNNNQEEFLRPLLSDPVTDRLFSRTAANLLGLKEANLETVREICQNKLRFDFMMPQHFYDLLDKVNGLPPVFPDGYDTGKLPLTPMVFMSNLNRIMSMKHEQIKV